MDSVTLAVLKGRLELIADEMDAKPLDAANGPFKLVVTEDKRPARCVHNLVSIELKTAD